MGFPEILRERQLHHDLFAERAFEQFQELRQPLVHVEDAGFERLRPRESEEPLHHFGSVQGALERSFGKILDGFVEIGTF